MTSSTIISVLLILFCFNDWWSVWLVMKAYRRHRDVEALRDQGIRFTLTAIAATAMAALGLNFLLGSHVLPRGVGFILLAAGVLIFSAPSFYFNVVYYRRNT